MAFGLKRSRQRAALVLILCLGTAWLFLSGADQRAVLTRKLMLPQAGNNIQNNNQRPPTTPNTAGSGDQNQADAGTLQGMVNEHRGQAGDSGSSQQGQAQQQQQQHNNKSPAFTAGGTAAPIDKRLFLQKQGFNVTVVLAKNVDDDIKWVDESLEGVSMVIYNLKAPPEVPGAGQPHKQEPQKHARRGLFGGSSTSATAKEPVHSGRDGKSNVLTGIDITAYFTYIIDHYDNLPDIVVFANQAGRRPQLFDIIGEDLPATLRRLNGLLVWEEGYVNLNCDTRGDCPRWTAGQEKFWNDAELNDYQIFNGAWNSINPGVWVPYEMGQPGGNQFAATREQIRGARTKTDWSLYRDWVNARIVAGDMTARQSSRVWEFLWQYIFKNKGMLCRKPTACYCDTYGICLGSDQAADDIFVRKDGQNRLIERFHKAAAAGMDTKEWVNSIDRLKREMHLIQKHGRVEEDRWLAAIGGKPKEEELKKGRGRKGKGKE